MQMNRDVVYSESALIHVVAVYRKFVPLSTKVEKEVGHRNITISLFVHNRNTGLDTI